jgi:hypothetical protein
VYHNAREIIDGYLNLQFGRWLVKMRRRAAGGWGVGVGVVASVVGCVLVVSASWIASACSTDGCGLSSVGSGSTWLVAAAASAGTSSGRAPDMAGSVSDLGSLGCLPAPSTLSLSGDRDRLSPRR